MAYYPPTDWELKDFYREHVDSLYRSCCFLTCGEADAQAMVKTIFLKLLNKGMIFSTDKDGKAWMILTAYKMSRKRSKSVRSVASEIPGQTNTGLELSEQDGNAAPTADAPAGKTIVQEEPLSEQHVDEETSVADEETKPDEETAEPTESAVREEPCEAPVQSVKIPYIQFPDELRKLSRRDRLIALMYYCEGYRKAEIANYLGCPTFMINSRLKRIKKRILQEIGGDEPC